MHHGSLLEGHPKLTKGRRLALRLLDHGFTLSAITTLATGVATMVSLASLIAMKSIGAMFMKPPGGAWQETSNWSGMVTLGCGVAMIASLGTARLGRMVQGGLLAPLHDNER